MLSCHILGKYWSFPFPFSTLQHGWLDKLFCGDIDVGRIHILYMTLDLLNARPKLQTPDRPKIVKAVYDLVCYDLTLSGKMEMRELGDDSLGSQNIIQLEQLKHASILYVRQKDHHICS